MKFLIFLAAVAVLYGVARASVISELRHRIQVLHEEIELVRQEQQQLAETLETPDAYNVSSIGFFAYKTAVQRLGDGDIITWEAAPTNLGDGFTLVTNSFICPVPGYYFFQYNLFNEGANQNQACSGTLVEDGINQVRGHSRIGGNDTIALTVSQSAFFSCEEGQRVTIQSDFNDNFVGSNREESRSSSFNGFLVFEAAA